MFGLTMPTTVTKTATLTGRVLERHLDEAIAKEDAKQLNHDLNVTQHAQAQAAMRQVSTVKHHAKLHDILTSAKPLEEAKQATVDTFIEELTKAQTKG